MTMVHNGPVELICAVVLLGLLSRFAVRDGLIALKKGMNVSAHDTGDVIVRVPVQGMSCGKCVQRLSAALLEVEGVARVEVTLEPGDAVVRGNADRGTVLDVIRATGYDPGTPYPT